MNGRIAASQSRAHIIRVFERRVVKPLEQTLSRREGAASPARAPVHCQGVVCQSSCRRVRRVQLVNPVAEVLTLILLTRRLRIESTTTVRALWEQIQTRRVPLGLSRFSWRNGAVAFEPRVYGVLAPGIKHCLAHTP